MDYKYVDHKELLTQLKFLRSRLRSETGKDLRDTEFEIQQIEKEIDRRKQDLFSNKSKGIIMAIKKKSIRSTGIEKKADADSIENISGDLFERISYDLGVVSDRWDEINREGAKITFGEGYSDRDLSDLKSSLRDFKGIVVSLATGADRLISFIDSLKGEETEASIKKENKMAENLEEKEVLKAIRSAGSKSASIEKKSQEYGDPQPSEYEADADDLIMLIDNEEPLYRKMVEMYKNLSRKKQKGTYDPTLAPKIFKYIVDPAAKQWYEATFQWADVPGDVVTKVSPEVRRQAQEQMAKRFEEAYENKEYDFMGEAETSETSEASEASIRDEERTVLDSLEALDGGRSLGTKEIKKADYQGWKNYETWNVALWIDNDQGLQEQVREMAAEEVRNAPSDENVSEGIWSVDETAKFRLADKIKDIVEEQNPLEETTTMYTDLLNAAIGEVDWAEVAEHYIEETAEEGGESGEAGAVVEEEGPETEASIASEERDVLETLDGGGRSAGEAEEVKN